MATGNFSDYKSGSSKSPRGAGGSSSDEKPKYWDLETKKRAYLDYLGTKREEIEEQQDARRFVHGDHWTREELKQLKARRQPAVYENITARKVRGIVGTLERLKQDPKAFPRTPKHEKGAEIATACVTYALDAANWSGKDPHCSQSAAIDGIGGLEFDFVQGDTGDPEITLDVVDIDNFFYDPRSIRHDFSDARYLGVGKWFDVEAAIDMFPDKEDEIRSNADSDTELTTDSDKEQRWYSGENDHPRVRIVEIWYIIGGKWVWALFTGSSTLMEGESDFYDEKGKTTHKYEMFSAYVDNQGDRYGIVRDLKPLNREMNMRRSKALYTMLSRRIIAANGAFDDVEVARREASRSDGVVLYNPMGEQPPQFDDMARQAEGEAQFKFYESLRTSIENFGPNVAVVGQGLENSSGRAINLLQQAGMADLGPFIQSYRDWKIRVYRKMWNAIQRYWTAERFVRVTDDDELGEFLQVNGIGIDENTGMPTLVNSLGNLDVDIILDEGPDEVNAMGDAYDTLTVLAKNSGIPPEMIKPWFKILLELSPLPGSLKRKLIETLDPEPSPEEMQQNQIKQQLAVRGAAAEVEGQENDAALKKAQTVKTYREAEVVAPEQPDINMSEQEDPQKVFAEALDKLMAAKLKDAQADKVRQDIALEPQRMAMESQQAQQKMALDANKVQMDAANKSADRAVNREESQADRAANQQNAAADRQVQIKQADRQAKQTAKDSDRNYKVNMKKASAPKGKPK